MKAYHLKRFIHWVAICSVIGCGDSDDSDQDGGVGFSGNFGAGAGNSSSNKGSGEPSGLGTSGSEPNGLGTSGGNTNGIGNSPPRPSGVGTPGSGPSTPSGPGNASGGGLNNPADSSGGFVAGGCAGLCNRLLECAPEFCQLLSRDDPTGNSGSCTDFVEEIRDIVSSGECLQSCEDNVTADELGCESRGSCEEFLECIEVMSEGEETESTTGSSGARDCGNGSVRIRLPSGEEVCGFPSNGQSCPVGFVETSGYCHPPVG